MPFKATVYSNKCSVSIISRSADNVQGILQGYCIRYRSLLRQRASDHPQNPSFSEKDLAWNEIKKGPMALFSIDYIKTDCLSWKNKHQAFPANSCLKTRECAGYFSKEMTCPSSTDPPQAARTKASVKTTATIVTMRFTYPFILYLLTIVNFFCLIGIRLTGLASRAFLITF